jgi:hypothetical protein
MEERRRQKLKIQNEQEKKQDQADQTKPGAPDEEDLEMEGDASYPGVTTGKTRFDQLIKTMIARIELNNTLAPRQEYGRHQTKAMAKKNKKTAKQNEQTNDQDKSKKKVFNDRFYDLDDDFIDDGDIQEADYGAALAAGGFNLNEDLYFDEADGTSTILNPDQTDRRGFEEGDEEMLDEE